MFTEREQRISLLQDFFSKRTIKKVAVDFDNTLIKTYKGFHHAYTEACGMIIFGEDWNPNSHYSQAYQIQATEFQPITLALRHEFDIGMSILIYSLNIFARLKGIDINSPQVQRAHNRIIQLYNEDTFEVFPGAIELIDTLNVTGVDVIQATHADHDWNLRKIVASGFSGKFKSKMIFSITDVKSQQWPQKLRTYGINSCELLVIGDNLQADLMVPMQMGATGIWVNDGNLVIHSAERTEFNPYDYPGKFFQAHTIAEVIPTLIAS